MKRIDGEEKKGCGCGGCVAFLLVILLLLLFAPTGCMLLTSRCRPAPTNEDGSPMRPAASKRITSVYVGDVRYLAADKDEDGRVDCLYALGGDLFVGRSYRAPDFEGRCTRSFRDPLALGEELRNTLNRLIVLRYELRASIEFAQDLDGDGRVDCVLRSLRGPALFSYDVTRCEADEWTRDGDPAEREAWDEVLALNNEVERVIAASGR